MPSRLRSVHLLCLAAWLVVVPAGPGIVAQDITGPVPEATQGRSDLELGTGFALSSDGAIVTTAHEVEHCRGVAIALRDAPPQEAREVRADRQMDLALIRVALPSSVLPLAVQVDTDPAIGEAVFLLGFPMQKVLRPQHPSFYATNVAGLGGIDGDPQVFRLPFAVLPGMSGSAVLDGSGRVVGVVKTHLVQSLPNGPSLGGQSFVISGPTLGRFLRANNVTPVQSSVRALSSPEIAARALASSVTVLCRK